MKYTRLNNIIGWIVFAIATIVYFLTLESTVSLWDCGEYIMASYKLEVGHPPGAPLFMLIGRMFTFFAAEADVAVWINRMSGLSSSFTILFMFWSITALLKKMVLKGKPLEQLSAGETVAILGSGIVGSLAYTFSETFWFSAVEGEVYAMASLFTAIVFWAILKWDEEMALLQNGQLSSQVLPNRWLLLIMFLIGLAIGVHLLGILLVPAIAYMIFFRTTKEINWKNFLLTGIISIVVLSVIQDMIIPGTISMASSFEVFFRNSIGLPFNVGTVFFFLALISALIFGLRWAGKKGKTIVYNAIFGLILLFIGYGSFAVIVIRSNANTPMDQNNPENLVNLHTYLTREQYGSTPIVSGPYWNSMENGGRFDQQGRWIYYADKSNWKDRKAQWVRRFIVTKNDQVIGTYLTEKDAQAFAKTNNGDVSEKFYEVNADIRKQAVATYAQTTIFPRMFDSDVPQKIEGYKNWSGYDPNKEGEKGSDKLALPSFGENITYFLNYQVNWMYSRYLMWNLVGRQNDIQGHGDDMRGNWKSGLSFIDTPRLGDQSEAPFYTTNNPANNSFFFIPLILTLIGLIYHAYKSPKDAFVVFLGFLLTGFAILIYLNQRTFEPRERDYAYAGSFYFLMIWLGIGVFALYQAFKGMTKQNTKQIGMIAGAGLLVFLISDLFGGEAMTKTFSWIWIAGVSIAAIFLMKVLNKVTKSEVAGASVATLLGLSAPLILGMQGWDDHNRHGKTTAHDVAYNYLVNLAPNSVIFTNGDNDTFPLWYIQEVEKFRSDVRVVNTSLLQTDWYTAQMMRKTYTSEPLPIGLTPDQILMYSGGTDQVMISSLSDLYYSSGVPADVYKKIIDLRLKLNRDGAVTAVNKLIGQYGSGLQMIKATNPVMQGKVAQIVDMAIRPVDTKDLTNDIHKRFTALKEIVSGIQGRTIEASKETIDVIQGAFDALNGGWEIIDAKDALQFMYNDNNRIKQENSSGLYRIIPSNALRIQVNKDNAIKSGVVKEKDRSRMKDFIDIDLAVSYLTREEIVMLDVTINSDFKRGIYFSNPYGAKVSRALYDAGAVKQVGSNYVFSPVNSDAPYDVEEFYDVMMNRSHFGNMSNPKVLTDYYARRHTVQFRSQFASLARYYVQTAEISNRSMTYPEEYLTSLKASGDLVNYNRIMDMRNNNANIVAEANKKVVALLNKSLAVMPAEIVLDGGEANQIGGIKTAEGQYPRYGSGVLTDYVQLYYDVNAVKEAEKLGNVLAGHYEQAIKFFLNAPVKVALNEGNHPDFYAALDQYFQLAAAANEENGNPNGALAKRTMNFIDQLMDQLLPKMIARLEQAAADAGSNREKYQWQIYTLKDYIQVLAADYNLIEGQKGVSSGGSSMDFNQMINEQNKQDSVLQ